MRRALVLTSLVLTLAVPTAAAGDGGPVPASQGGAGVGAPDGTLRYVAVGAGARTVVVRIDRGSGAVERSVTLRGHFGIPGVAYDGSATGLSGDGRTLVLARIDTRYPPRQTALTVLDTARMRVQRHVVLAGWFGVDAVSPDGRRVYLVHYLSPQDATRYEVRAYDLRAGRLLRDPVVDPREPDERMGGIPVTRATSAGGRWAYTLYMRPSGDPFIHALDTARGTAACIDLPSVAPDQVWDMRLVVGPGGGTLGVEHRRTPVALVDTRTFAVRSPRRAAPARRSPGDGSGSGAPWELLALPLGAAAIVALRRRRLHRQDERHDREDQPDGGHRPQREDEALQHLGLVLDGADPQEVSVDRAVVGSIAGRGDERVMAGDDVVVRE